MKKPYDHLQYMIIYGIMYHILLCFATDYPGSLRNSLSGKPLAAWAECAFAEYP